jgi:drug/metabolite transporter (DMT)-like permease
MVLLLLIEAALVICWSGGFIGIRFASEHAPIFLILLWRSLVSGLMLLPFALAIGPALRWTQVRAQILFGVLGMSGYLGGFALAIVHGMPTGLVALVADTLPLMVAVLSWPILGQALTGRQWLGSLIGLVGVLIASGWALSIGDVPMWVYGLPIAGTLSLAVATLLQKRDPSSSMPLHQSLCIQCLTAAAIFSGFAWHEGGVLPALAPGFVGGILWLVLVATFGGWGLYYLALRASSPARVTSVLYLSPPVVMVWAWAMFDEPMSWAMALGLVISLCGIIMVAKSQRSAVIAP